MQTEEKKQFRRELMALALPLALQSLLNALVGATDAFILGRLNQESVAAVSLANQITFIMNLFIGASTGGIGVLAAQYFGKKDYKSLKRLTGIGVRYACIVAMIFFLLANLFPAQLMEIFTEDAEMIRIGASYLRAVSYSYVFMAAAGCFQMLMKVAGFAKLGTLLIAVSVAVDVTADIFLVYGFGTWKGLGANGSAYSTVVVELLVLMGCIFWSVRHQDVHIRMADIAYFSKQLEGDIWKIIPGLLAGGLAWGLSISMHSFIMGHLGVDATAAYSITAVTQQLVECFTQGFAGGSAIMLGTLLGSHQLEKARRYGDRFWKVAVICGIINAILVGIIGPVMYYFYKLEPLARHYLVRMLIVSAFYMFAYSFNTIFTCGVFPAGGDTRYDAVSVIIATWCICIPVTLIACFVWHLPAMTVYTIMCLDEIVKFPFLWPRYHKFIWLKDLTNNVQ